MQEVKDRGLPVLDWWEIIVKPGIKKLAINRGKEIKDKERRELNMMQLKQAYFTRKLQEGESSKLGKLREIQSRILEKYEEQSKRIK